LGCIRGKHAAPSANADSEWSDEEEFVSSARVRAGNCAPRDECVDSGLRRGRRRLSSAHIATTSLHYHQRHAGNRNSVAGRNTNVHRYGFQRERYERDVEREWYCERLGSSWNDFRRWSIYGAPDLPSGGTVQVTATSHADASRSASASVTISSDIAISRTPNVASVELEPSLSRAACPSACGAVDANGTYTAPQILPSSAAVNLTATSVADPTKQSTATVTITSRFTLQISAPGMLGAGSSSTLIATLTPCRKSFSATLKLRPDKPDHCFVIVKWWQGPSSRRRKSGRGQGRLRIPEGAARQVGTRRGEGPRAGQHHTSKNPNSP
jgi:hypothetical protein